MVYIRNSEFEFKAVKSTEVPSEIYKDLHPYHWVTAGIRTRDENLTGHPIDHSATCMHYCNCRVSHLGYLRIQLVTLREML